jgi:hypothetical protein
VKVEKRACSLIPKKIIFSFGEFEAKNISIFQAKISEKSIKKTDVHCCPRLDTDNYS